MTLASVLTPAANGPIVSVAFCGWGGGRSNLGRDEEADRWAWFIRKKFGIQSEKPTLGRRPIHVCFREKSGHRILSASSPFMTQLRHGDLRRRASDHTATVLPAEHISREPGTIPTGSAAEPVSPFQPCGISRRAAGLRHGGVHAPHRVLPVASSCECTGIISCSLSLPGNMTKGCVGSLTSRSRR